MTQSSDDAIDAMAVVTTLRDMALLVVDDNVAAGELLADWVGRRPSLAGEVRLRILAELGPKLVADAVNQAGWGDPGDLWTPKRPRGERLPLAVETVVQAVVRHLNGEADAAKDIVAAYVASHGLQGMWDLGTAALRLLATEMRDQRRDAGDQG